MPERAQTQQFRSASDANFGAKTVKKISHFATSNGKKGAVSSQSKKGGASEMISVRVHFFLFLAAGRVVAAVYTKASKGRH